MYWRRRLTRLELALYATLIGLAVLVFVERALYYMELAERTAMETTVMNVNSALAVRNAFALLRGEHLPQDANPFDLAGPPPNYLGALASPNLSTLQRGVWIFDATSSELVYLPRLTRNLESADPQDALRFKATLRNGIYKLAPTNEYSWR